MRGSTLCTKRERNQLPSASLEYPLQDRGSAQGRGRCHWATPPVLEGTPAARGGGTTGSRGHAAGPGFAGSCLHRPSCGGEGVHWVSLSSLRGGNKARGGAGAVPAPFFGGYIGKAQAQALREVGGLAQAGPEGAGRKGGSPPDPGSASPGPPPRGEPGTAGPHPRTGGGGAHPREAWGRPEAPPP